MNDKEIEKMLQEDEANKTLLCEQYKRFKIKAFIKEALSKGKKVKRTKDNAEYSDNKTKVTLF